MSHKSSRRDFLHGKSALAALGDLVLGALPAGDVPPAADGLSPPEPAAADDREDYFLHVGRQAMAARFEIFFNVGQYGQAVEAALEALDEVDRLEERLSFFRPASQLSAVNLLAGEGPVTVEPALFELLQFAVALSRETDGAFDITSTPLWEAWGFSRRQGRIPADGEIAAARANVGSHLVELDPQRRTVRFRQPGVRLNLGSIGKGFALDRCAEILAARGIDDFLVHGGMSSILARGAQLSTLAGTPAEVPADTAVAPPAEPPDGSWIVGIRHPLRPDRRLAELQVSNQALGTSGSQAQSFWHEGKRYGHILDPRSGRPALGVFSTTVLAPTALLADALSTAFYVMPHEAVLDYCGRHPEVAAILLRPARCRGGFELQTAGLRPGQLTLLSPVDAPAAR